jgi:hypothetical protein
MVLPREEAIRMAVLQAYIDESGIDKPDWCVVGGFVGSTRSWSELEDKWRDCLLKAHVPCFHAKQFFGRKHRIEASENPYLEWSDAKALRFLLKLLEIIHVRDIDPIGGVIPIREFQARSQDERRWLTGGTYSHGKWRTSGKPNAAYALGFQNCFAEALQRARAGVSLVHFICDQQNVYEGWVRDFLRGYRERSQSRYVKKLGDITFSSKERAIPLQASDLFVYTWRAFAAKRMTVPNEVSVALTTFAKKRRSLPVFGHEWMQEMVASTGQFVPGKP